MAQPTRDRRSSGALMLCVAASGAVTALAISAFTLSWTHSVEHTLWRESWVVTADSRLQVIEASVEGSGAGVAVPPDAVWTDGRWTYRPALEPLRELSLASSGATVSPWTLCPARGGCVELGAKAGEPIRLWAARSCETS